MGFLDPFLGGMGQDEQMMLAAGLLRGNGNLGANLSQGLLGAQQQRQGRTERELEQIKLQQMKQQLQQQEQRRLLAQQAFTPGVQPLTPNDDEGNAMPSTPGGGGLLSYAQGLLGMGDVSGYASLMELQKKQQPKYHNVNGNLVPEPTMPGQQVQPVYQAPEKAPDWMNPQYVEIQKQIRAAGRPQVTVDTRGETKFAEKMGENYATQYDAIIKGGMSAQNEMRDLTRFSNIVSRVPTGKLEPLKAEVGRLAAGLGIKVDTEKLGFQEALEALSNQFALQLRNPSGGAGMPGALSDKDRDFLTSIVPGLAKTPEGNRLIIEAFKRVAQRKAEIAQLARAYKARTGGFDDGFYTELENRFGSQDLLGDLYEQASGLGVQNQASGSQVFRFDSNGNPL